MPKRTCLSSPFEEAWWYGGERCCIFRPDGGRQVGDVFKRPLGSEQTSHCNTTRYNGSDRLVRKGCTRQTRIQFLCLGFREASSYCMNQNRTKKKMYFLIFCRIYFGAQINVSSPLCACSEEIFPSVTWKILLRTCQALEARCTEYSSVWTFAGGLQYTSKQDGAHSSSRVLIRQFVSCFVSHLVSQPYPPNDSCQSGM